MAGRGSAVLVAMTMWGVLLGWPATSAPQGADGGYRIFRPDGVGPHPAIAFVSGCSGFSPRPAPKSYERIAGKFQAQGYLVLFVDYVGRRGIPNCSRGPISEADAAADLVAALAWLRSQPFVDATRLSAIGWAYGGGAVLVALADYSAEQLGLSRAVVYYPLCRAVRPWKVATPVLMLFAGDDEVAPSEACRSAARRSARPDAVTTVTYHGALHAFDMEGLPAETTWAGGMIGHNPQAAAAAWEKAQQFLKPAP